MRGKTNLPILRFFLVVTLSNTACEKEKTGQDIQLPSLGFVPATIQRNGNPQAGYDALINQPYITCGIPFSAYRRTANPPLVNQLLPGRTAQNREIPYLFTSHVTKDNVRIISSNCLLCHAGYFNNQLIVGLGNEFLDFTVDPSVNAERSGTYIDNENEAREWKKWADRIAAIAPYTKTDTIGMNPAVNLTFALMAHRDPITLAWSQSTLMEPPPQKPLPVSVPPWWRMKKKNALFYNTEGRGDHARIMMLAATLCTDSLEEAHRIDTLAADIRAYLVSLDAPEYPYPIDAERASKGKILFENNCSSCHGTHGNKPSFPNLVFGYTEIGTDPELAKFFTAKGNIRFVQWFNQSFFGENSRGEPAPGYIAPPLDGIWATAPYFHNGSVPTIEGVLYSTSRPRYWLHPREPSDYNEQTLGWNHTVLDYGKQGTTDKKQRQLIYDTTAKGYSNAGHTYGDHLNNEERSTLIEYIKTL